MRSVEHGLPHAVLKRMLVDDVLFCASNLRRVLFRWRRISRFGLPAFLYIERIHFLYTSNCFSVLHVVLSQDIV